MQSIVAGAGLFAASPRLRYGLLRRPAPAPGFPLPSLTRALMQLVSLVFVGCFASCKSGNEVPDKPTFTEHIAPILNANCNYCHHAGGSGHFDFTTYALAKANGPAIAYATKQRMMPPWPADPHYTEFVGQRVLSDRDLEVIQKWLKDGMPEGPADKLPPLPDFTYTSLLGKPDMTIAVSPVTLHADEGDQFLLVKVPFELPHDTFASVVEFVAGPHNAVHHVNGDMVKYDPLKKANVFDGARVTNMVNDSTIVLAFQRLGIPNDDGSYPVLIKSVVNYLPGVFASRYPNGMGGFLLPRKGAFLLNDMHFGNSRAAITDSSFINIYFSPVPPSRPVEEMQLGTIGQSPVEPDLRIEPNTTKSVSSRLAVPKDISILTVNPHMHLLGKSFKAYALTPGGDTIRLISIPHWDFNWQYFYTFKKPVKVPAGSTIIAEGVYDNTKNNPYNPFSPPQLVTDNSGSMKSTDEMFQFIVSYLPYQEGDEQIELGK